MAVDRPPVQQKSPLTVGMLAALEAQAVHAATLEDRVAAGFFVFCVLARARFSDAMAVQELALDLVEGSDSKGYLEGRSRAVKTATTTNKRLKLLPMVAPAQGVTDLPWAKAWIQARSLSGLVAAPGAPLLPSVVKGQWTKRPLGLGEAKDWLLALFDAASVQVPQELRVGTHSMKVTTLSWCAKFGLPVDVRRHLGYHVQADDVSALTYSRDAASHPLRCLEQVLGAIRSGRFDPDATRSGYFHPTGAAASTKAEACHASPAGVNAYVMADARSAFSWTVAEQDSVTAHDSPARVPPAGPPRVSEPEAVSSDSTATGSSSSGEVAAQPPPRRRSAAAGGTEVVVRHRASGIHHKVRDADSLACGRVRTQNYSVVHTAAVPGAFSRCKQCFGDEAVTPVDVGDSSGSSVSEADGPPLPVAAPSPPLVER